MRPIPSLRWVGVLCALLLSALLLAGCGGSSSKSSSGTDKLPLTSPKTVSVTGKDGSLLLYWTKLAAIQGTEASYEVFYNTTDDFKTATKVTTPASVTEH